MFPKTKVSIQEFEALGAENPDLRLEYINGEIIELVSNLPNSQIAAKILIYVGSYLLQNPIGRVSGADGGYQVGEDRYIPDVAFLLNEKQPIGSPSYCPYPPDLAVEVVSLSNTEKEVTLKVTNYLAAHTLVWVVYPEDQEIVVYEYDRPPKVLGIDGILEGGSLFPGFSVPVRDIFA
jgi:Uma2 family endonuclease